MYRRKHAIYIIFHKNCDREYWKWKRKKKHRRKWNETQTMNGWISFSVVIVHLQQLESMSTVATAKYQWQYITTKKSTQQQFPLNDISCFVYVYRYRYILTHSCQFVVGVITFTCSSSLLTFFFLCSQCAFSTVVFAILFCFRAKITNGTYLFETYFTVCLKTSMHMI